MSERPCCPWKHNILEEIKGDMGNTDSKLSSLYREHVLQLAGETVMLRDDNGEFSQFYKDFIVGSNCTMEMFNHLISPKELKHICKSNSTNINNLVEFISLTIIEITDSLQKEEKTGTIPLTSTSLSPLEIKLADLLVCVRILTKIYPVQLSSIGKENWFWDRNEDGVVPGFLLLKALLKLLFVQGFTVPCANTPGQVTQVLWENGIYTQDPSYELQAARIDSNRLEIINLLLALCSADLYGLPSNFLVSLGYLAPEYDVVCLVASIVNTVCRYCTHSEESSMPYRNFSYKQSQQQQLPQLRFSLVSSCLQLLNLMCLRSDTKDANELSRLVYPDAGSLINSNIALSYLSTLSREFDLRLLLTSFAKIFKLPVNLAVEQESSLLSFPRKQSSSSLDGRINSSAVVSNNNVPYGNSASTGMTNSNTNSPKATASASKKYKGSDYINHTNNNTNFSTSYGNSSVSSSSLPPISPLFLQSIIFLTVLVQNNRIFQNYVADKFGTKLIIFIIYYLQYYDNSSNQNSGWELTSTVIPLCYNLALFFSSKKLVLSKMLETFSPNYYTNKLPNFFKLSSGNINHLTYRDFAIIHLCNMAISDVRENLQPKSWLFELIYNLLPIRSNLRDDELVQLSSKKRPKSIGNGGLSYNASMSLLHLLSKMSNKNYLTTYAFSPSGAPKDFYACSPGYKLDCLALLLRVVSIYIVLYFEESKNLTFALCRHQRILFQIKDSIDTISKDLNAPISDLKIEDYFEHAFNLEAAKQAAKPRFGDHDEENNANQALIFNNKRMSIVSENDRINGDDSNDDLSAGNLDDNGSTEMSRSVSGSNLGRNIELWEYADLSTNLIMSDRNVHNGVRPKWPVGITAKSKAKKRAGSDLNSSWAGSSTLPLLIRSVRILLKQFPSISTISTKEYYQLLSEVVRFKITFENSIEPYLPVFISGISEAQPLKVDLSPKNLTYQSWVCMVCWSDIFNTHSAAYPVLQVSTVSSNYNTNKSSEPSTYTGSSNGVTLSRVSSADTLEGSMLSGTNSNSSSLMGYLSSHRNNEASINSPLEIASYTPPNSKSNGSKINDCNNSNGNSATSFLRFAWNGLTKKDNNYAPIQEDSNVPSSPIGCAPSRQNSFVLDTGLLKPNIWTGTKVRLFDIKTKEREEFSLLDMTSSLLRRLRFNSITSSSSTDTLNSAGGNPSIYSNGNTKSNDLNPRPYTPKDSILMLSTTKK